MRVYFVTRHYGQARGGLGRYEESLFPQLEKRIAIDRIPIRPVPVPRLLTSVAGLVGADLAAVARNHPCCLDPLPDDAIVHLSNQNLALALLVNQLPKSVITVHDIIPYVNLLKHPSQARYGSVLERLLIRINARSIHKATRIIADSDYTRNDLINFLGINRDKIDVVPLGVDHSVFRPLKVPADFYVRYHLRAEDRYILYVGSKDPRKNLKTLCAAVRKVCDVVPWARLLIVGRRGTPEQEKALREWVRNLNLTEHVRFIPFLPLAELPLMYNASTVFVYPSLYEGFGLPTLEAMACGCPVVASNATSLPEVVGDGGLLIEPKDVEAWAAAIVKVLTQDEVRQELRERGLKRAQYFSDERQADETIKVYEKLLQQ